MRVQESCYADPTLYLLADEALIDSAERATFRLCPMEKAPEPVLLPTMPWEGGDRGEARPVQQDPVDGTVLYDPHEKKFHLWYRTHNNLLSLPSVREGSCAPPQGSGTCYATSPDGIHWDKPNLGLVNWRQSCDNNMFTVAVPPVKTHHLSGVVPNYVPGLDAQLIGTVYSHYDDPVYPMGITFLTSPDGLRWTPHWPPCLPLDGDAHCLMWDWHQQCYICTTRSYIHAHEIRRLQALHGQKQLRNKRHVAVARSRDLVHWTPMMPVLEADEKDPPNRELYYMYILPYGHGYLGFVQTFDISPDWTYGPLEMHLAFSRDLLNWRRIGDRTPVLPRGPQGAWDQSHVSLCTNPPHPEEDRLRFWYGGKDTEHWQSGHAGLGTATLRRDGFACYEAGSEWGVVTTAPMKIDWATKPFISIEAPRGEARVEILDADTLKPIDGASREDCRPLSGDDTLMPVVYGPRRGTFVRHTGRIRFRFHLRNARLYAFKAMNCLPEGGRNREKNLWL